MPMPPMASTPAASAGAICFQSVRLPVARSKRTIVLGNPAKLWTKTDLESAGEAANVFIGVNTGNRARVATVQGVEKTPTLRVHSLHKLSIRRHPDHRQPTSFRADSSWFAACEVLNIEANALVRLVPGEDNLFSVGSKAAGDMIDRIACSGARRARLRGKKEQLSGRSVGESQDPRVIRRERLRISVAETNGGRTVRTTNVNAIGGAARFSRFGKEKSLSVSC